MKKKTLFALLSLLFLPLGLRAQNVTISPLSGDLVKAVTDENETGFQLGLAALWRHEQLSLSVNASDEDPLGDSGELSVLSAVLGKRYYYAKDENNQYVLDEKGKKIKVDSALTIIGGHRPSFLVVSLPKGYRFTRYKIVLVNDLLGDDKNVIPEGKTLDRRDDQNGFSNLNSNGGSMRFYETKPWTTGSQGYNTLGLPTGVTAIKQTADIVPSDVGREYVIERTSQEEGDMTNLLYFRLTKDYFYYGITIKSFEVYFTAEGTFTETMQPTELNLNNPVSVTTSGFTTSKIDIGELSEHEKDHQKYFSFEPEEIKDLVAYNYLYQGDEGDEAVLNGVPTEGQTDTKKIYSTNVGGKYYYGLKNGVYYVEPPVEVQTSNPDPETNKAPIGYRIVGAKLNYSRGTNQTAGTGFYITYTLNGKAQYLGTSGLSDTPIVWQRDNQGYISSGGTYLARDDGRFLMFTTDRNLAQAYQIDTNGYIYYMGGNNGRTRYNLRYYTGSGGGYTNPYNFQFQNNNNNRVATQNTAIPSFTAEDYTIKVYNADGTWKKDIPVDGSVTGTQSYDFGHLNNDAIKFEIDGVDNGLALVTIDLQLQALDPYITSMDIVCTDLPKQLQLTQTFTASDFRVSGGEFIFYVPDKYRGQEMQLEFSNLRSDYADETYPSGSIMHYARHSFVTSPYFLAFDEKAGDRVENYPNADYPDIAEDAAYNDATSDGGLYDSRYSPDLPHTNKVFATTGGNIRFKFNNAKDLETVGDEENDYLIETPFSMTSYLGSEDPDGNIDPETGEIMTGALIPCKVIAGDGEQKAGSFFMFTADEPRYNIAPTTAWQHRSYAFYRMDVKAVAKDYDPKFDWVPIYDTSLYDTDDKTNSLWGLKVTTKDTETEESVVGYLTYETIIDFLEGNGVKYYTQAEADAYNSENHLSEGDEDYKTNRSIKESGLSILNEDNDGAPATSQQILYVDFSDMLSVLKENNIDETTLKSKLGTNAFIFLPEKTLSEEDNVAIMTGKVENVKSFDAGRNVVLTDKQPFFTPYDVQVASANYAIYTRLISDSRYDKDVLASVILPFTLTLSQGKHNNNDGIGSFWVSKLGSGIIGLLNGSDSDYGTAYFQRLTTVTTTEANKPYMIQVDTETVPNDDNTSFIAKQYGSTIKATPITGITTAENHTGTLITGDATNVTFKSKTTPFTNSGTYSGARFDRTNDCVFYFANQQFVSMNELNSGRKYMYVSPFRGIYTYPKGTTSREFSLKRFEISFDEPNLGDITGISDTNNEADLMIHTEKGSMTITAAKAQEVTIYSANGARVAKASMQGGDTQTVNLSSGVYIVNNVKIAVK